MRAKPKAELIRLEGETTGTGREFKVPRHEYFGELRMHSRYPDNDRAKINDGPEQTMEYW